MWTIHYDRPGMGCGLNRQEAQCGLSSVSLFPGLETSHSVPVLASVLGSFHLADLSGLPSKIQTLDICLADLPHWLPGLGSGGSTVHSYVFNNL